MRWALLGLAMGLGGCAATPPAASSPGVGAGATSQGVGASKLLGATAGSVLGRLGPPRLTRIDGPAEVWLYRTASCRMTLILYRDAAGNERVATASALAAPGRPTRDCTAGLSAGLSAVRPQARLGAGAGPS